MTTKTIRKPTIRSAARKGTLYAKETRTFGGTSEWLPVVIVPRDESVRDYANRGVLPISELLLSDAKAYVMDGRKVLVVHSNLSYELDFR